MDKKAQQPWSEVIKRYVGDVLDDRNSPGKFLKASVSRYVDDIETAGSRGFEFNVELASDVLSVWPVMFSHTVGEYAGSPFEPYPWQAFQLWNIFGWLNAETGHRRFRQVFQSVARGNGKSPFAASIMLYLFALDVPREPKADCFCAATTVDQASIVFREACRMVKANLHLDRLIRVRHSDAIIDEDQSILEPVASNGRTLHGRNPHGIVVDELHAFTDSHRELREAIETAMGKRRQPLCVCITTAGDTQSTLWRETYDYAKSVVYGHVIDDSQFAVVHEIDDEDDPLDEDVWCKANPMLEYGIVKRDHLATAAKKAKTAPETALAFKRFHCNRQVDSVNQIIDHETWSKGNGTFADPLGRECYLGFDWGWRDDLSALALCFPIRESDIISGATITRYLFLCDTWSPQYCPRDLDLEPWRTWIKDGWVRITQGDTTDVDAIYSRVDELRRKYSIREVYFDSSNCPEFGSRCVNQWRLKTHPFGQTGQNYHHVIMELLAALREGRVNHGGNPVLSWAAMNLVTKTTGGVNAYLQPSKRSSKDKIDPIIAVLMSLAAAMASCDKRTNSVYETQRLVMS